MKQVSRGQGYQRYEHDGHIVEYAHRSDANAYGSRGWFAFIDGNRVTEWGGSLKSAKNEALAALD